MTRGRCVLPALAALAAVALLAPANAQTEFESLFDGTSLAGWTTVGEAGWSVADGAVSADAGPAIFLVSNGSYRNFELRVEFWVSDDANSGVFIRCASRTEISATDCYEVNIYDTRPDPTYGTGAIVNLAPVSPMPKAGGHWNTMVITAREDMFSVTLNGRTTVEGGRATPLTAKGRSPFSARRASSGSGRSRYAGVDHAGLVVRSKCSSSEMADWGQAAFNLDSR